MKDPTYDSLEHYFFYNIQLYLSKVNAVHVTPPPTPVSIPNTSCIFPSPVKLLTKPTYSSLLQTLQQLYVTVIEQRSPRISCMKNINWRKGGSHTGSYLHGRGLVHRICSTKHFCSAPSSCKLSLSSSSERASPLI